MDTQQPDTEPKRKPPKQAATETASANGSSPEPILAISTLAPTRDTVAIDDKPYELAMMRDFGIEEQQALSRDGAEFSRLWEAEDELEPHESARLRMLMERLLPKVFHEPLPADVAGALDDEQRGMMVVVFMRAPQLRAAREAMMASLTQEETAVEPGKSST